MFNTKELYLILIKLKKRKDLFNLYITFHQQQPNLITFQVLPKKLVKQIEGNKNNIVSYYSCYRLINTSLSNTSIKPPSRMIKENIQTIKNRLEV